jgi:hypothetical protein
LNAQVYERGSKYRAWKYLFRQFRYAFYRFVQDFGFRREDSSERAQDLLAGKARWPKGGDSNGQVNWISESWTIFLDYFVKIGYD